MKPTWLSHYQPPQTAIWHGRNDGNDSRLHHRVRCYNLANTLPATTSNLIFCLVGFCCDEGVKRNMGRVGAVHGPYAIRQMLVNIAFHANKNFMIYDCGDITCRDEDLELAQTKLADLVAFLHDRGYTPIVLGGGHEVAFGHYQGIGQHYNQCGVINFDAHLDVRPLITNNRGTSGTPFLQIANWCQQQKMRFDYLCIGVQDMANTTSLFETANQLEATIIKADACWQGPNETTVATIQQFVARQSAIYLTFCLDVFAASVAPGVSAPQTLGLFPWQILPLFDLVIQSNKVVSFDVAELAPPVDRDGATARLAATLVSRFIHHQIN